MGVLKIGQSYRITIDSDPGTPGTSATILGWVPLQGMQPAQPVVDSLAPGGQVLHAGNVPHAQALLLDFDVPDAPASRLQITVEQGAQVVAQASETRDGGWSFLVVP